MGALVVKDAALAERLAFIKNSSSATPVRRIALVLRGLKTCTCACSAIARTVRVAEWLVKHPKVERVYWPGLPTHPNHAIAKAQMRGFGGMIGSPQGRPHEGCHEGAQQHGTVLPCQPRWCGSLLGHPASMTHASIPREERLKNGLADTPFA